MDFKSAKAKYNEYFAQPDVLASKANWELIGLLTTVMTNEAREAVKAEIELRGGIETAKLISDFRRA